ncbi:HNH endonuclease [Campylobacter lari]|uniref:HNH endonuclease n=1 Tax=Campylobacter lari TaxID=201 RepID=UPI00214A6B7D|nr:HNH endonuclease [Campylobacter lari]MCR2081586.1 HNH endonuclease [Campylobacter lari subsp. concheus]
MNTYKFCKCGKKILSHLSKCSECKITTVRNQNKHYDAFKRDRDSSSFYYSVEWKKLRSSFINDNPFCFKCGRFAKIVDHVIPIRQGGEKLNVTNLQSLCMTCHNKKTKEELKGVGG